MKRLIPMLAGMVYGAALILLLPKMHPLLFAAVLLVGAVVGYAVIIVIHVTFFTTDTLFPDNEHYGCGEKDVSRETEEE